jgi:phage shock protein C
MSGVNPRHGSPSGAWDQSRIYRNAERGWMAGVCAGIADYVGTEPMVVRLASVLCVIFFFVPTIVAYLAFALVLPRRPPRLYGSADEETFWRGLRSDPGGVLHTLRERFRSLERRLAGAETVVTSDEFDLRRRFRDIGG